jgi:hypothetical protein
MFKRRHVAYLRLRSLVEEDIQKVRFKPMSLSHKHIPNSACILLHDYVDPSKSELWHSVSEDIVMEVFKELMAMQKRIHDDVWQNRKMQMTQEDKDDWSNGRNLLYMR